jgi:hypothetical protein
MSADGAEPSSIIYYVIPFAASLALACRSTATEPVAG